MAVLNGTPGNDSLVGGADNDVLNGLAGNDTLNGGVGADTMIGGLGDDVYFVDNTGDVVSEGAGEGTDSVNSSINYTLGANVENLFGVGPTGLTLTGNALANIINGTNGGDIIFGGNDTVVDTLNGGRGDDTYIIRGGPDDVIVEDTNNALNGSGIDTVLVVAGAGRTAYTLNAGAGVENLIASDASSTLALNLTGNDFSQNIAGNNGANVLTGGGGADTLTGFGGNDTYNVDSADTVLVEAAGGGNDTANITANNAGAAVTYNLGTEIETINVLGTGAINVTGGASDQLITGNDSANLLNGGGGVDTLNGGLGNDTYVVDSLDDVIVDAGGTDRVNATGSYQLNIAGIEVFAATGTTIPTTAGAGAGQGDGTLNLAGLNTTTNAGGATTFYTGDTATTQTIYGNAGANILNGRQGDGAGGANDTLVGGSGDDIYRVYGNGDVVVEDTSGGNDTIYTSENFSLAINDTNARAAAIGANTGANYLAAGAASQIENLIVADATSTTNLALEGNAYGQIIVGNYGNNTIFSGGVGSGQIDQLSGLRGDDIYVVTGRNTTVNENVGEGTDTVFVNLTGTGDTFFSLITQAEVEYLTAFGGSAIDLQGSSFAQVITGNNASNTILGGGGADTLVGAGGSDNYLVDSQSVQIVEFSGVAGTDTVFTTVSYDLANSVDYRQNATAGISTGEVNIEVLSAASQGGTDAINLTGNSVAQTVIGNYGDNILNGDNDTTTLVGSVRVMTGTAAGDTLIGLFGNDTYRVYSQNDVIQEQGGQGTDTAVFGTDVALNNSIFDASNTYQLRAGNSIEVLTVANQSRTVGYQLIGNAESQTNVLGSRADDALWGGAGNDTLTGNGGNDVFGFNEFGSANADVLADFNAGDRIGLATTANGGNAAVFSALGATFDSNEFVVGTAAVGTNAQIVYNQTTGQIFYDADGTGAGAAELVATVAAGTALGFNDFITLQAPPTTPV